MGRQISFYMGPDDERAFLDGLRAGANIAVIPETSFGNLSECYRYFYELEGRRLGDAAQLWNRSISPRPLVQYFPEQGYYCVDSLQSEVVSIIRCRLSRESLTMGRLHLETTRLDDHARLVPKGAAFLTWYDGVAKWIRKSYKIRVNGAFTGPGARSLAEGGAKLVGYAL